MQLSYLILCTSQLLRCFNLNIDSIKVSILVPVFNADAYVARCLDSILELTHRNIEIVCIDDGSQDSSPIILDEYAARNPSKVVVEHRGNSGAAAARNRAIQLASGDYLAFVDNDDWIEPDYVEVLLAAAMRFGAEVVCSGYCRPDCNNTIRVKLLPQPEKEWSRYAVGAAWSKLYRMDYVKERHLEFLDTNIDEDLYFTLPSIELANRVEVIPYCGYNWFINATSVSNTNQRSSEGLLFEETLDAIIDMLKEREIHLSLILIHYFIRLVVWFLLYTCKSDGSRLSRVNRIKYINWLNDKLSAWRWDVYATPRRPMGDAPMNRIAVWLFVKHPVLFAIAITCYSGIP